VTLAECLQLLDNRLCYAQHSLRVSNVFARTLTPAPLTGPKVDRMFTVTSTGGAQVQHSDDEDEDEVEGNTRALGQPMTPAPTKRLSRPTGLGVRFWPAGSRPSATKSPATTTTKSAATVSTPAPSSRAAESESTPVDQSSSKKKNKKAKKSKDNKKRSAVSTPSSSATKASSQKSKRRKTD
jgi:hypothetical protein